CLIICYIDKFGFIEMPRVIEKAFIWAYRLRLSKKAVHLASIDNHVLSENLFMALGDAVTPIDFFSINLTKLEEIRFKGVEEIKTLVKEMKYYDGD
ncbi:MAG: hypothetical protein OXD38_02345, partial [Aestuariivita sp.]|nr:hypothetical protein [Aestuariivita sp.]